MIKGYIYMYTRYKASDPGSTREAHSLYGTVLGMIMNKQGTHTKLLFDLDYNFCDVHLFLFLTQSNTTFSLLNSFFKEFSSVRSPSIFINLKQYKTI